MGYEREQAEYFFFDKDNRDNMEGPDCYEDFEPAHNCDEKDIWFDEELGISRCRNCGWSS